MGKLTICSLCFLTLAGSALAETPRRFLGREEASNLRGPNTRVWENLYEVDVLDPITRQPTGEKRIEKERYYEKATNLCYQALVNGVTQWVLTDPVFKQVEGAAAANLSYEVRASGAKVGVSRQFNDSYHVGYAVGDTTVRFGMAGIGLYERTTGKVVMVGSAQPIGPMDVAPDRLRYTNAFPGCDVEYENSLAEFKQLVQLHGLGSVPDPQHYGLDPKSTYFVIASRMNLHELDVAVYAGKDVVGNSVEGETLNLTMRRGGEEVCSLVPGFAWEPGNKPPFAQPVFKRLIREATQTTLLEGVPYTWLTAPEREFPVTIDYVVRTGSQNGDEVWREGVTYHVSNPWWVGGGDTLVIEPGAVIKLGSSGVTNASIIGAASDWQSYGRVRAIGNRFNYVVATSWRDDTVGEDVSAPGSGNPAIGDYDGFVSYAYAAYQDPAEFGYVKVRYATTGLIHGGAIKVHDSIFRDCYHGMTLYGYADPSDRYLVNNLFTNCRVSGITVLNWGGPQIYNVENNTFATNLRAIWFLQQYTGSGDAQNAELRGYNNLITDVTHSLNFAVETTGWKGTYDGSDFLNTAYSSDCIFEASIGSPSFELSGDPYESRKANGGFYLNNDSGEGEECRDNGTTPSAYTRGLLASKTVTAPTEITTNIVQNATWWPLSGSLYSGSGDSAIGYHYDRVDYVIGNAAGNYQPDVTATLRIKPGVVVSYWRDDSNRSAELRVRDGGSVISEATPGAPIHLTSVYATSDKAKAPSKGDYGYGIIFDDTADMDGSSPLTSLTIRYPGTGLFLEPSGQEDIVVEDVAVDRAQYYGIQAVAINNAGAAKIQNCLLTNCSYAGAYLAAGYETLDASVQFCTFDGCGHSIYAMGFAAQQTSEVSFNLFTNSSGQAMYGYLSGTIDFTADTNLFWNNMANVGGQIYTTGTNPLYENPNYVHTLKQGLYQTGQEVRDGYYLAQNTSDYSVRPLRAKEIQNVTAVIDTVPWPGDLFVYGYENLVMKEEKYNLTFTSGTETPGSATQELDIALEFVVPSGGIYFTIADGDYVDLELGTGSVVRAMLPAGNYYVAPGPNKVVLPLWVAVDGSSFWGRRNASYTTQEQSPDQDAIYAMRFDGDAPARGTNEDGANSSLALDKGIIGYYSTGTTQVGDASDTYRLDMGYHYNGSIIHDPSGPVITFETPSSGAYVARTADVTVSATDEANLVKTIKLSWSVDGEDIDEQEFPPETFETDWDTENHADGAGNLIAYATDQAGNMSTETWPVSIDNTPPIVSLIEHYVHGVCQLVAQATDVGAGVKEVGFIVKDGGVEKYRGHTTTAAGNVYTISFRGADKGLVDGGAYDVIVCATDNLDNYAASSAYDDAFTWVDLPDIEYTKDRNTGVWFKLHANGLIQTATEDYLFNDTLVTSAAFANYLGDRAAVSMEVVREASSLIHWQIDHVIVMDNEANWYKVTYPHGAGSATISGPTQSISGLHRVKYFEQVRGLNQFYILDATDSGRLYDNVSVTDYPHFVSNHPWGASSAKALAFDLIPDATGDIQKALVASSAVSGGKPKFFRLDDNNSHTVVNVDSSNAPTEQSALSVKTSPKESLVLFWQDDNRDGDGTVYYHNRRTMASESAPMLHEATSAVTGIPLSASMVFQKWGYLLSNPLPPAKPAGRVASASIQFNYVVGTGSILVQQGDSAVVTTERIADIADVLHDATPIGIVDHVVTILFQSSPLLNIEERRQAKSFSLAIANAIEDTTHPFSYRFGAYFSNVGRLFYYNGSILSSTIDALFNDSLYPHFRGMYMAEAYAYGNGNEGTEWTDAYGNFLNGTGDYLRYILRKTWDHRNDVNGGKTLIWQEASWFGPSWSNPHPGRSDNIGNSEDRVGNWGMALYDTAIYNEIILGTTESQVVVPLLINTGPVDIPIGRSTYLASWMGSNAKSWGASLQTFWWGVTQFDATGDNDQWLTSMNYRRALDRLGLPLNIGALVNFGASDDNLVGKLIVGNPGVDPSRANWAETPSDILKREFLQYLSLGATVFEFEWGDWLPTLTSRGDHNWIQPSIYYRDAFQPIIIALKNRRLTIPGKDRLVNQCKVAVALDDVSAATNIAKLWLNDSVYNHPVKEYTYGVFFPTYSFHCNDDGDRDEVYKYPLGAGVAQPYWQRLDWHSADTFETISSATGSSFRWRQWKSDPNGSGIIYAATPSGHIVGSVTSQMLEAPSAVNFDFGQAWWVGEEVLWATPGTVMPLQIECFVKTLRADQGEVKIGYSLTDTRGDGNSPDINWIDVDTASSNIGWATVTSSIFYDTGKLWLVTAWIKVNSSADSSADGVRVLVDDFCVLRKWKNGGMAPKPIARRLLDGDKRALGPQGPYHDSFNYYYGDFLTPDVIRYGAPNGAYGEYAFFYRFFDQYNVLNVSGAVGSGSTTVFAGSKANLYNTYIGYGYSWSPGTGWICKDWNGNQYLGTNVLPNYGAYVMGPHTLGKNNPDGTRSRSLEFHLYGEDRLGYGLLGNTPNGHVLITPVRALDNVPGTGITYNTDGRNLWEGPDPDRSGARVEPATLARTMAFVQDTNLVRYTAHIEGSTESRPIFVSMSRVNSRPLSGNILSSTYQIVFLDAEEGGANVWGAARSPENTETIVLDATFCGMYIVDASAVIYDADISPGEAVEPVTHGSSYRFRFHEFSQVACNLFATEKCED